MADSTIGDLTNGAPAQSTDALPVQRASANFRLSVSDILMAISGFSIPNLELTNGVGQSKLEFDDNAGAVSLNDQNNSGLFMDGGGSVKLFSNNGSGVTLGNLPSDILQLACPVGLLTFTVATLPVGYAEGTISYASDGRKVGETPGSGTGVPVYFSNGSWRVFSTDAPVAA